MPDPRPPAPLLVRDLATAEYSATYAAMREFTAGRQRGTADEIWFVEHPAVFTQGQAGRAEHILAPGDIPVVQSNRGGQVTYHGPGQIVAYVLLDLPRLGLGVRDLVKCLEDAMIGTLAAYGIRAHARRDAPGVYVELNDWADGSGGPEIRKIGSLGLRISHGCSYHGLSLNVDMDLAPFARINPCGLRGMRMTQVADLGGPRSLATVAADLEVALRRSLVAGNLPAVPVD